MKLEFFLSLRYFIAKKRRSSISLISAISIACVALAVLVLIVVFSVLNGFHADMKSKILSKESHVVLIPRVDRDLYNYRKICKKIKKINGVILALPHYDGWGLIKSKIRSFMKGVKVRGVVNNLLKVDRDFSTGFKMKSGKFDLTKRGHVILGETLAQELQVTTGDVINLYVPPKLNTDDLLMPVTLDYKVAGIFSAGHSKYDEKFVFLSLKDAQFLYGVNDVANTIGIKLLDYNNAEYFKRKLSGKFRYKYFIYTWMEMQRNLFQALVTEKTLIGVVLFCIIAMAAFSIAGTLIMVVMEKEREIGILKSIGLTPKSIKRVFISQGFIVGMLGTLIGLILGLVIASSMDTILHFLEDMVNFANKSYYSIFSGIIDVPYPQDWKLFPQDVYYVSTFPVRINFVEIFVISLVSVILTTLCAFFPARQAAKLRVTEVLHKE
ncbi:MAG: ABC transporter permease [Spirochaetes bacterium]|nr:ABC transporter permease [Spirochaetota bacterium]